MKQRLQNLITESEEILSILRNNNERLNDNRLDQEIERYNNFIRVLKLYANEDNKKNIIDYSENIVRTLNEDSTIREDEDRKFDNFRFLIKISNLFTENTRNWLDYTSYDSTLIENLMNIIRNEH